MVSVYSVFYELDGVFDICRTDFSSMEAAGFWINHNLLPSGNAVFHFVLKDAHILIRGEVIDDSPEFFSDCMKFSRNISADQAWMAKLLDSNN